MESTNEYDNSWLKALQVRSNVDMLRCAVDKTFMWKVKEDYDDNDVYAYLRPPTISQWEYVSSVWSVFIKVENKFEVNTIYYVLSLRYRGSDSDYRVDRSIICEQNCCVTRGYWA